MQVTIEPEEGEEYEFIKDVTKKEGCMSHHIMTLKLNGNIIFRKEWFQSE